MLDVTGDAGDFRVRRAVRIRTPVARSAVAAAAVLGLVLAVAASSADQAKAAGPPSATAGPPDASSISFSQLKGHLAMPAPGRVILKPGEMTASGSPSKGIVIETADEHIIAPSAGLIVYAGEFRTYGQLLIVSPGEGYHVLIGGLAQIDVAIGKNVSAGDRIGKARKGEALTVELRKDARPLDATDWFNLPRSAPMK